MMRAELNSSMREGPHWMIRDGEVFVGSANSKEKANLFAAAPDLLAALETVYLYIDPQHTELMDLAARAIAKARGES